MSLPHDERDLFRGGQGRSVHSIGVDVQILIWLLIGLAAGIALGVLFHP